MNEIKTENYKFTQHKECEFFPCHPTQHPETFNCLFCYCPLYALGRKCGGSFRYNEKGFKDCTNCCFPHRKDNYEKVIGRYGEIIDMVKSIDGQ